MDEEDRATEALAEVWATIDGSYEAFASERVRTIPPTDPRYTGTYDGYMAEAAEMRGRLASRGYVIVARPPV